VVTPMFKKILIANRGEIAVRVIRACRELGIASVAVYSEVDRAALHVRKADEAYCIGPASARDSYLNVERILDAAQRSGCDAVHPGYGFLSENAQFAQACQDAGLRFIGPTPAAMKMMGSKTRARQAMERVGVSCVPGSTHSLEFAEAARVAAQVGYPIMLKAAAGGGGKGMRWVGSAEELRSSFDAARSESERAFGDNEIYIEKFIKNPRHIEMQVLADEHGHIVYLGERECSLQRRHQKVLEESPSPIVDAELRQRMGETAVRVAVAGGYTNAGTVEFLVDQNRNFYFLEMNTRLQVEHPLTELITGLDLVHLQIRIAAGEELPFAQSDAHIRGHAMECRIYAEDPDNNFFPSPGKITLLIEPSGPGIRTDSGMYEGWTVPVDYDPLLAKLIAYGSDRRQTIMRLERALGEFFVGGIKSNVSLFRKVLRDPDFMTGEIDTGFLDRLLSKPDAEPQEKEYAHIAAIAAGLFAAMDQNSQPRAIAENAGPWRKKSLPVSRNGTSSWKQAARLDALR